MTETIEDQYRRANDLVDRYHDEQITVPDGLLWAIAVLEEMMRRQKEGE